MPRRTPMTRPSASLPRRTADHPRPPRLDAPSSRTFTSAKRQLKPCRGSAPPPSWLSSRPCRITISWMGAKHGSSVGRVIFWAGSYPCRGSNAVLALIAALPDNHLMDGRETREFGRSSDFLGRVVLASLFPSNGEVALRTPGPEEPPGAAFDLRDRPLSREASKPEQVPEHAFKIFRPISKSAPHTYIR